MRVSFFVSKLFKGLGSTPQPQEVTDAIYLKIRGQSNAAGRVVADTLPLSDQQEQVDIYNFNTQLTSYIAGVNTSDYSGRIGVELFLAQMLRDYHNKPVIIDKSAQGGTFLYEQPSTSDWNLNSNQLWKDSKNKSVLGIQSAKSNFFNPQYKAMLWWQGEEDASVEAASIVYQANQEAIFADERNIAGNSGLVIVDMLIVTADAYASQVRTAKTNIANAQPLTYVVEADDLERMDNYHANEAGMRVAAQRIFDIIKDLWDFTV